jgi:hypothetical protein
MIPVSGAALIRALVALSPHRTSNGHRGSATVPPAGAAVLAARISAHWCPSRNAVGSVTE